MVLTTEFPCKPSEVSGGSRYLPIPACDVPIAGSKLAKVEREIVAAIVVQFCRDNGDQWVPVPANAFGKILESYANSTGFIKGIAQNIINEMWAMVGENLLVMDRQSTPQTLAATPALVELIK